MEGGKFTLEFLVRLRWVKFINLQHNDVLVIPGVVKCCFLEVSYGLEIALHETGWGYFDMCASAPVAVKKCSFGDKMLSKFRRSVSIWRTYPPSSFLRILRLHLPITRTNRSTVGNKSFLDRHTILEQKNEVPGSRAFDQWSCSTLLDLHQFYYDSSVFGVVQ